MVQSLLDYLHRVAATNRPPVILCELIIIGLVVWWILSFLAGTRGERIFRGVFFLLVAGILGINLLIQRYPLYRLQRLYNGFLIGILIITAAAFQPEIRRALMRIGQGRLWGRYRTELKRVIEEVVSAVKALSASKTGAIIVLERDVGLGEFTEASIPLDARVSSELIRTIFFPGTPLHDMAVVIRQDRLVAARVQLPLAEPEVMRTAIGRAGKTDPSDQELGSRHMAAVGITAGSDAVCVVVSEQTGTISLAVNGQLERHLDAERLRARLLGLMMGARQART
ncbi:MAG: diadenylate cyclase [Sedimentisphaerales bacterium]|jgi:diadenylate cyclase|nr:diadenylate cyclase [Sedimentisphaerales bacterium]